MKQDPKTGIFVVCPLWRGFGESNPKERVDVTRLRPFVSDASDRDASIVRRTVWRPPAKSP